ncbi:MAG: DUF58 domain-containing protein [Oscillospiraceae bacterium]|nr:DUF58 domain-containing protein [Oscillospiraceae bacterium]
MRKDRREKSPATRRLSYAFVLAVAFSWVFFFGGTVTYTIFTLCILLPALSILHLLLSYKKLALSHELSVSRAEKNQPFSCTYRLRNKNRFFTLPAMRVELAGTAPNNKGKTSRLALALRPSKGVKLSLPLRYAYRGLYPLPKLSVKVGDLLGLCWLDLPQADTPDTVTIFPMLRTLRNCRIQFGQRPFLSYQTASGLQEEASASSDSRLYQYGDPINRIHWKLTAQKGELIARQFETEAKEELLLLLDTTPPPPEAYPPESADRLVESALAVMYYCLRRNCPVCLMHGKSDGSVYEAVSRDKDSFDALFAYLAVVPFDGAAPLRVLAGRAAAKSFVGAVAFTAHFDEDTITAMNTLCAPQRPASVVYAPSGAGEARGAEAQIPSVEAQRFFEMHVVPYGADVAEALDLGLKVKS